MYNKSVFEKSLFKFSGDFGLFNIPVMRFTNDEGIELFEPNEILFKFKYKKRDFLDNLNNKNVFTVSVINRDNSMSTNVDLITEDGIYEMILLMNSPKARKIRDVVVRALTYERKSKGYEIDEFINMLYTKKEILPFNTYTDNRVNLDFNLQALIANRGLTNFYIFETYQFPVLGDRVITNERTDEDYIKHIDKAYIRTSLKVLYGIKATIETLAILFSVTETKIMDSLENNIEVSKPYGLDNLYYTVDNILDYMRKVLNKEIEVYINFKEEITEYDLYKEFVKIFFYDDDLVTEIIYDGTITFKDVDTDCPCEIFKKYLEYRNQCRAFDDEINSRKTALTKLRNKYNV